MAQEAGAVLGMVSCHKDRGRHGQSFY